MESLEFKKLYRSQTDRKIAGVCGGLGEYLHIDSTFLRLLWTIITFVTGIFPGVFVYILAAIIIPEKGEQLKEQHHGNGKN